MLEIKKSELVQKSKEILSVQVSNVRNAGFGYLDEVLRVALFRADDEFFKNTILPVFLENNIEIKVIDG